MRQRALDHRADRIGDPGDDDVDGVLDVKPLRRGDRQIQELVGRLCRPRTGTPDRSVGQRARDQNAGSSTMSAVPKPSDSGSARIVTAERQAAQRRLGGEQLHDESCTMPECKLKVPIEARQRVGVAVEMRRRPPG